MGVKHDLEAAVDTHTKGKTVVFVNGEKYTLDTNTVQVKALIILGGGVPEEQG